MPEVCVPDARQLDAAAQDVICSPPSAAQRGPVRLLICMVSLLIACAAPAGVFDIGTMRADRGQVILDPTVVDEIPPTPMLQRVAGIRAVLTSRDLSQLRAGVIQEPRIPLPDNARRVAFIRLGAASRSGLVEILQLQDGTTFAREVDPQSKEPPPLAARIRRDAWDKVARTLDPYRAGFTEQTFASRPIDAIETATVWPAPWIIDGDEIDRRFIGRQTDRMAATRDLAMERFAIHVGPAVTAHRPAGLLVWLSPTANANIPQPLADAASRCGFIIIAPTDIGGTRDIANRLQLSLDAAYAAMERWHIDPTRVYVGGFSAGARMANLVWMAYPEIFKGSLLVGGASFYQEIQVGPANFWPRQYNQPVAANMQLLAGRRSAVIVGENDPSRLHAVAVAKRMSLESIRAESYVVPQIAHEIPAEPYLVQGLRWLDTDAQAQWDARARAGADMLTSASNARDPAARRRTLLAVTREAPWTPAAWTAFEMLKEPAPGN